MWRKQQKYMHICESAMHAAHHQSAFSFFIAVTLFALPGVGSTTTTTTQRNVTQIFSIVHMQACIAAQSFYT